MTEAQLEEIYIRSVFNEHRELRRLGITDLRYVFNGPILTGLLLQLRAINAPEVGSIAVFLFQDNGEMVDLSPTHPNPRTWTREELWAYNPEKIIVALNLDATPDLPRCLVIFH